MLNKSNKANETVKNKKGEKIMKKVILLVVTTMIMGITLTGCSNSTRKDEQHATVTLTTSDGQAYVYQSVNSSNSVLSGKTYALQYAKKEINMKTGETIHITFKCDACKNVQEIDVDNAWADVIHCDCPEEMDEHGNAKEYIAFEINYMEEEELSYEKKYEQAMFGDLKNK